MKQKVKAELMDMNPKKARFDLSGELKENSAVMHTYAYDESYNRSSVNAKHHRKDASIDFLQPGFGGFSYHEGASHSRLDDSVKSKPRTGARHRNDSRHSRSKKHITPKRDSSNGIEWDSKQRNRRNRLKLD